MPARRSLANAIRFLSMDAVQRANSGHPGMPMGMADIAEVLWNDHLKHNPENPQWPNRDRFILSNGHGSMLHYSLLHLTGYDVSIEDIKAFRQLHSKTPGHPEFGLTPGIETTTGPLGQGIANAVGMALAESILAATYNREKFSIIDHFTYVFLGDGCLMEGISHEACSFAGHQQLGKLIAFYDDNHISIDGSIDKAFSDDTVKRFQAYGWQVIANVDGHNPEAINDAISAAKTDLNKPTLICCRTIIGYGSPKLAGSEKTHGAPLGEEEITATRAALNWSHAPFEIPDNIYAAWDAKEKGQTQENNWNTLLKAYANEHPKMAAALQRRLQGELPGDWASIVEKILDDTAEEAPNLASRKASGRAINAFAKHLPELIGGSADLTGSNNTNWTGCVAVTAQEPAGNYIYYGVREFAMAAIGNGLALHGGFIPYVGTFLVFSDYMRNAMRLSALMKARAIFVLTHDSIGLGEDGPTHQPVEHAASLRIMPNMTVWRPADTLETTVAWATAIEQQSGPSSLLLSRQTLSALERTPAACKAIVRGGYTLLEAGSKPDYILIASGSEVQLALDVAAQLQAQKKSVSVVSMPSSTIFKQQTDKYRHAVLPKQARKIAIEAGVSNYWYEFVGHNGLVIGLDTFGESAPASDVFTDKGFTTENILQKIGEKYDN